MIYIEAYSILVITFYGATTKFVYGSYVLNKRTRGTAYTAQTFF